MQIKNQKNYKNITIEQQITYFEGMENAQNQYFTSEKKRATIQITKRSQAGFPKVLQDDPSGMKEAFVMLKIFEEIEEFMEEYYESFSERIH